jgi:hypothetical protein
VLYSVHCFISKRLFIRMAGAGNDNPFDAKAALGLQLRPTEG